MRTIAALLAAFAMSLNGMAASACSETTGGAQAMGGPAVAIAAATDHRGMHHGESETHDCCADDQPADMDCHVACLSSVPVLAGPEFTPHPPLFADARPALEPASHLDAQAPSPPRRPPRLQS